MYDELLQILKASPVLHDAQITDLKTYGRDAFRVKMRATVTPALTFQLWLNRAPDHTRYAYQLFGYGRALLRWDNAPHHPYLTTNYPHHFHDSEERIIPSTLGGDPLQDLPVVLAEIERYLSKLPAKTL